MKLYRYLFLLLLLACSKDDPIATNGNLIGRVTDVVTSEPISGALVSFKGNSISTGADGTFSFTEVYADSYTVSVSKAGYQSDTRQVTIIAEKTATADFMLERLLPGVTPNNLSLNREALQGNLTLENKQSEKLTFTTQTSKSWISVSPSSATIEPGNSQLITVSINPQTLSFGTYNETLVINVSSSSVSIPIVFVYEQAAGIAITKPLTDEIYKMGEIMPISWTSNLNGKVKIELIRNSSVVQTIVNEVDNNEGGNYSWEIPALNPEAYLIKVTSIENPTLSGTSGAFTLQEGPTKPTVSTGSVQEILVNSIKIKGNITSLGLQSSSVSQYGHVYSKFNPDPSLADLKTSLGAKSSTGEFTSTLTGLDSGESYFIRAYAVNAKGASYGDVVTVTTVTGAPIVETIAPTSITQTSATLGGKVVSNGGGTITQRGIAWGETSPVSIDSDKLIDGQVTIGNYTANLTSLSPGKTYYYKAYAVNSNGVGYGEQLSVKTVGLAPTVVTLSSSAVSGTKATIRGRIDSDGGESLSSHGFVYGTTQNPTLQNEKLQVGTTMAELGEFTGQLTALSPSTKYYVRAYATNGVGTTYGSQIELTTTNGAPEVTTVEVVSYTGTKATIKGKITSDGGESISAYGFVYSTETAPTLEDSKKIVGTTSTEEYQGEITGLSPETKYYVRAFVTNSITTAYGTQKIFTTTSGKPGVTSVSATNITYNSAKLTGKIDSEGDSPVFEFGFVLGTNEELPMDSSTIIELEDTTSGTFTTELENIDPSTKYYYRAYASNEEGTALGGIKNFTTLEQPYLTITSPVALELIDTDQIYSIKWTTNMSNKQVNIQLFNSTNQKTDIALGVNISLGQYNWSIPETFTLGSYKIKIVDKETNVLLAETGFFTIQEGCKELPMQNSEFEEWLFDNGFDDILDNKVLSCRISSIKEISYPIAVGEPEATRIDWSIFNNLEVLKFDAYTQKTKDLIFDLKGNLKLYHIEINDKGRLSENDRFQIKLSYNNDQLRVLKYNRSVASSVVFVDGASISVKDLPNIEEIFFAYNSDNNLMLSGYEDMGQNFTLKKITHIVIANSTSISAISQDLTKFKNLEELYYAGKRSFDFKSTSTSFIEYMNVDGDVLNVCGLSNLRKVSLLNTFRKLSSADQAFKIYVGPDEKNNVIWNINSTNNYQIITNMCSNLDSDNDGVYDPDDNCPSTPSGENVDQNGCSDSQKDSDGDGISDAIDECPNTPSNEEPNSLGCSYSQIDTDGDGVKDIDDLCPNSPENQEVDENGCHNFTESIEVNSVHGYRVYNNDLYKSTDGGITWTFLNDIPFEQIEFNTKLVGFGIYNNDLYKTSDGGVNWTVINDYTYQYCSFVSANIGYGFRNNDVYKTTNGGEDWSYFSDISGFRMSFPNSSVGYVTDNRYIYKVDSTGKYSVLSSIGLYEIEFVTGNIGYGTDRNDLYKTTDGGKNWEKINDIAFSHISFVGINVGYGLSNFSRLYRTLDGGINWELISDEISSTGKIDFRSN